MWQEISDLKRTNPQTKDKETLPDVLSRISVPGKPFPNLLLYVQIWSGESPGSPMGSPYGGLYLESLQPTQCVPFHSRLAPASRQMKVFAATEVYVLARNPNLDAATRGLLDYYLRCAKSGKVDLNIGFISA